MSAMPELGAELREERVVGGFSGDGNGLMAPAYGFAKLLAALPSSGEHGAERRLVGLAVPGDRAGMIEEDSVAAADRRLAVSEHVPRETEARREVLPGDREPAAGHSGVAREHHSEGRVHIALSIAGRDARRRGGRSDRCRGRRAPSEHRDSA